MLMDSVKTYFDIGVQLCQILCIHTQNYTYILQRYAHTVYTFKCMSTYYRHTLESEYVIGNGLNLFCQDIALGWGFIFTAALLEAYL